MYQIQTDMKQLVEKSKTKHIQAVEANNSAHLQEERDWFKLETF